MGVSANRLHGCGRVIYWSDDGDLLALRLGDWKIVFKEQLHTGLGVWSGKFTNLRLPKPFNPKLASTSWLLRSFGDSLESKRNCHVLGEDGVLENPVNQRSNE
jgi:hypothetical protein